MITTSLSTTRLPRSAELTDALLAPAGPLPDPAALSRLRLAARERLAEAVSGSTGAPVIVDAFAIRRAARPRAAGRAGGPFHWSARTAARTLGIGAARCLVDGRASTPTAAVAAQMAAVVDEARRNEGRPGSLGEWLGHLAEGGRVAVAAEATAWATRFDLAVDWRRVGDRVVVGPPDRWWAGSGCPEIRLRGRVDARLRTPASGPAGGRAAWPGPPGALFTALGGWPGPTSRAELGLAALVDLLGQLADPLPARVVGWWPAAGRALVLAVDLPLLQATLDAAVDAARAGPGLLPQPG